MSPAQATACSPIDRAVPTLDAAGILRTAADTIAQRGKQRDTGHGSGDAPAERSMARIVAAFNAATGHNLTERDGWIFQAQTKIVRGTACQANGTANPDDYIDGAAYFALAGESVCTAPAPSEPGA